MNYVLVALLLPVALLIVACLLDRLERRVVAEPPAARTPVARPAAPVEADAPIAPVVALRPGLDGDTARLRRAA